MPILVLELLKYAFLVILYIFLARAVKAVYLELRPAGARRSRTRAAAPAPARPPARQQKKTPKKLTVVEGDNLKNKTFELGSELIIGRSEKCHVILEDPYVSQMHARVFARDDGFAVEDLGSTNGTYLNRTRVTGPRVIQRGDRVKIGKTVLEARR